MKMDNVEFVCTAMDLIEHDQGAGRVVANPSQPQPSGNARYEISCGFGIATREQADLMTLPHQLFRQPGNNPFGAAV